MNPFPYREVFHAVERRLIELGTENLPAAEIHRHLDKFKKYEARRFSDDDYFRLLVRVAFYSGFRAATVTSKIEVIERHFPNWIVVSAYDGKDIREALNYGRCEAL